MKEKQGFIERFRKWRERPPKAFSGSVLANYLGWQLLRVFWLNVTRRPPFFRTPAGIKEYADILRRDGVVSIPDFLPEDIFKQIRREHEKESAGVEYKPLATPYVIPKSGKVRVHFASFIPPENSRLYALLDEHIIKNKKLRDLGSVIVRRKIDTYRPPQVFINRKEGDEYPDLNSDIYYHADVSYPGVKAFYYLSDASKENGAFIYAKGTHKLTWGRLKWEYRKSIEHAKNRKRVGDKSIKGDETGRRWHCLTREEGKRMGIEGTSMEGKANSLVVFNVMGFHRRGDFSSDKPREFAHAYYRN